MDYNDLWDVWLKAREEQPPKGIMKIIKREDGIKPYFTTPENMNTVLTAFSPYDLYQKPNSFPATIDYSTSAFNIHNLPNDIGIKEAILLASRNPKNKLSMIEGVENVANAYPEWLRPYTAQGIYEHEQSHFNDPRLLFKDIKSREEPANKAEKEFYNSIKQMLLRRAQ